MVDELGALVQQTAREHDARFPQGGEVARCACPRVSFQPNKHPDGTHSERWKCVDCGTEFVKRAQLRASVIAAEWSTKDEFFVCTLKGFGAEGVGSSRCQTKALSHALAELSAKVASGI
jgi:hypothetical protein